MTDDTPKHLQVRAEWLGQVLALLTEIEDDNPKAARLLKDASMSIQDKLVAIRRLDLNNPAHAQQLNKEDQGSAGSV